MSLARQLHVPSHSAIALAAAMRRAPGIELKIPFARSAAPLIMHIAQRSPRARRQHRAPRCPDPSTPADAPPPRVPPAHPQRPRRASPCTSPRPS